MLNASYEPLNVTSVRRAHVLVFKGKAEVLEELDQPLRSATTTYAWPHVIRLVHYVKVPRAVQRKISRRALFRPGRLALRLLRNDRGPADAGPRRAAKPRRRLGLGERRHLLRAVQLTQGQPVARGGQHDAPQASAATAARALHPPGRAEDSARLAPISTRSRRVGPSAPTRSRSRDRASRRAAPLPRAHARRLRP